jgi:hypothetical protein
MGGTAAGRGPAGTGIVGGDVAWDRRYLLLEPPAWVHTFAEFGPADVDALLSPVAVTEPWPNAWRKPPPRWPSSTAPTRASSSG